jgi:hypothetical protein
VWEGAPVMSDEQQQAQEPEKMSQELEAYFIPQGPHNIHLVVDGEAVKRIMVEHEEAMQSILRSKRIHKTMRSKND